MAKFSWNMQGLAFQGGIKSLRKAYTEASEALEEGVERVKENAIAYQQSVEEGRAPIEERDEDGYLIWSQDQVYDLEYEAAVEALRSLRKAFAVSLYHHWERGARAWTNAEKSDNHPKLIKKVKAKGYKIDSRLDLVRAIANLIKHDNDRWGNEVKEARPDLIDMDQIMPGYRTEWYYALVIPDEAIGEFFEAVAASGPDEHTLPSPAP